LKLKGKEKELKGKELKLKRNTLSEKNWKTERILWIGYYKDKNCLFYKNVLPKEIFLIILDLASIIPNVRKFYLILISFHGILLLVQQNYYSPIKIQQ